MTTGTAPSLDRDYATITGGAGLIDRSARGKVDVTGPDAADYLQGQLTNDVLALAAGEGCYAALLDPKAHITADMRVLSAGPEELWIDTERETLDAVLQHLRMYKIGRQVEIADRTSDRALLSLLGPASAEVATKAAGIAVAEMEHAWVEAEVGGAAARFVTTSMGVDAFAPVAAKEALRAALLEAGATEIGDAAAEVLRAERGIPRHGVDMGPENLPGEAGIVERAVSFTKGCYIGQEPVARMYHRGRPNRSLRGLRLDAPVAAGEPLFAGEREVGRLTTAVESPRLGPIGLAIVRREVATGDRLAAGAPASGTGATVVELPFQIP